MHLTLPNLLTIFRIVAIPAIVGMILVNYTGAYTFAGMDWIACCLYIVTCLTDYFDGAIARHQKLDSELGRILDPVADKILVSTVLLTLAYCGHLAYWTVIAGMLILGRELLVSGLRDYLSTKGAKIHSSRLAKWKTLVQMTGIGFLIAGDQSAVWLQIHCPVYIIGAVLLWASVIPTWFTGIQYIVKTFKLLKHEKA